MRLHPLSRAVSAVLRAIAAKKQIDQHTIAKRTGYTDDKVSRLLGTRRTGAQPIGLDDADMIANALDADLMAGWAAENGLSGATYQELVKTAAVQDMTRLQRMPVVSSSGPTSAGDCASSRLPL